MHRYISAPPDADPPVITFSGKARTYGVDDTIDITCRATDAGSGIATANCPEVHGPAYDHLGTTTLNASATDNAGNTTSASTSFTLVVDQAGVNALIDQLIGDQPWVGSIHAKLDAVASAPNANARAGKLGALGNALAAKVGAGMTQAEADLILQLAGQL